jgi:hypothetical protein
MGRIGGWDTKKGTLMGDRLPEIVVGECHVDIGLPKGINRESRRLCPGRQGGMSSVFSYDHLPSVGDHRSSDLQTRLTAALTGRQDVDRELKRACEELINHCTRSATSSLRLYLEKCTAYLSSRPHHAHSAIPGSDANGAASVTDLAGQEFATPDKVKAVHEEFKRSVVKELEEWKVRVMVYLQDEETVRVLVPPAQVSDIYSRTPSIGGKVWYWLIVARLVRTQS